MKNILGVFVVVALAALIPEFAWARDLVSASRSYATTVKQIAQAASVTGIVVGGLFMQLPGAGGWGRMVLSGGLVGAACAFGAPAFASFLTTVFGSG